MSVDDVWGVETRHMNQSELDTEPGSATKDKKSMMTKKRGQKSKSQLWESNFWLHVSDKLFIQQSKNKPFF